MHMTASSASRIFPASRRFRLLCWPAAHHDTNLTSDELRENPSQLYTITARVTPTSRDLDRSSLQVSAVVDGQNQPMRRAPDE